MGSIRGQLTKKEKEQKYWIKPSKLCVHRLGGPVMTIMHLIQTTHKMRDGTVKTRVGGVKCRWMDGVQEREAVFHTKDLQEHHG